MPQDHESTDIPLLEIYAPVRETGTNRIIAVAEFYELRESLGAELRSLYAQNAIVFGSLCLAMVAYLTGTMTRQQQNALRSRVDELSHLLAQNEKLQDKVNDAHRRMMEANELFLRRVSAELHDGPAQLIGFVLLRLEFLVGHAGDTEETASKAMRRASSAPLGEIEVIRGALVDSLQEIRNISAGLAPPELDGLSLEQALSLAAANHARRTGSAVACHIECLPDILETPLKICLYRFVQEGLNNAYRHAGGREQEILARCEGRILTVEVRDRGEAPCDTSEFFRSGRLGLVGLRGRIEALRGTMDIQSQPELGTRLVARFSLDTEVASHA